MAPKRAAPAPALPVVTLSEAKTCALKSYVSVVAVVHQHYPPKPSKGKDKFINVHLVDDSLTSGHVDCIIFGPEDQLPNFGPQGSKRVLHLHNAKVQDYNGTWKLCVSLRKCDPRGTPESLALYSSAAEAEGMVAEVALQPLYVSHNNAPLLTEAARKRIQALWHWSGYGAHAAAAAAAAAAGGADAWATGAVLQRITEIRPPTDKGSGTPLAAALPHVDLICRVLAVDLRYHPHHYILHVWDGTDAAPLPLEYSTPPEGGGPPAQPPAPAAPSVAAAAVPDATAAAGAAAPQQNRKRPHMAAGVSGQQQQEQQQQQLIPPPVAETEEYLKQQQQQQRSHELQDGEGPAPGGQRAAKRARAKGAAAAAAATAATATTTTSTDADADADATADAADATTGGGDGGDEGALQQPRFPPPLPDPYTCRHVLPLASLAQRAGGNARAARAPVWTPPAGAGAAGAGAAGAEGAPDVDGGAGDGDGGGWEMVSAALERSQMPAAGTAVPLIVPGRAFTLDPNAAATGAGAAGAPGGASDAGAGTRGGGPAAPAAAAGRPNGVAAGSTTAARARPLPRPGDWIKLKDVTPRFVRGQLQLLYGDRSSVVHRTAEQSGRAVQEYGKRLAAEPQGSGFNAFAPRDPEALLARACRPWQALPLRTIRQVLMQADACDVRPARVVARVMRMLHPCYPPPPPPSRPPPHAAAAAAAAGAAGGSVAGGDAGSGLLAAAMAAAAPLAGRTSYHASSLQAPEEAAPGSRLDRGRNNCVHVLALHLEDATGSLRAVAVGGAANLLLWGLPPAGPAAAPSSPTKGSHPALSPTPRRPPPTPTPSGTPGRPPAASQGSPPPKPAPAAAPAAAAAAAPGPQLRPKRRAAVAAAERTEGQLHAERRGQGRAKGHARRGEAVGTAGAAAGDGVEVVEAVAAAAAAPPAEAAVALVAAATPGGPGEVGRGGDGGSGGGSGNAEEAPSDLAVDRALQRLADQRCLHGAWVELVLRLLYRDRSNPWVSAVYSIEHSVLRLPAAPGAAAASGGGSPAPSV